MPNTPSPEVFLPQPQRHRPFRRAVWRGLAILMPPLLTIVIFLWVGSTIERYVLSPVRSGARDVIAWSIADVRVQPAGAEPLGTPVAGEPGVQLMGGKE